MRSDVVVVGGGMVGAAIAYGLARAGAEVRVLDEGDGALRAARGNFGLTWVQTKGFGVQPYFLLSRGSVDWWGAFASELGELTGLDIAFRRDGGLILCLGEREAEERRRFIDLFRQQAGNEAYDCRFLDRAEVQALFPAAGLGPRVTGASFSPMDGHANPLFLLRALLEAVGKHGGSYHPGRSVQRIDASDVGYVVTTSSETFHAGKLVIAAGLGTRRLAAMIGLDVPVRPERGQLIVTERTRPLFPFPMSGLRQTAEGTIMIGVTHEDVGLDTGTTAAAMAGMAERAVASFPVLAGLRAVRAWAALRVLTPDGVPIYAESKSSPGAFAATCHSGVTLAAMHARLFPDWVLEGRRPPELATFDPGRFDVRPAA